MRCLLKKSVCCQTNSTNFVANILTKTQYFFFTFRSSYETDIDQENIIYNLDQTDKKHQKIFMRY